MKTTHITLIAFALWTTLAAMAQGQELQVVTKTIERTFAYQAGTNVNVEGQKAEVYFETWSRPQVQVRLVLESRHADRDKAESALDRIVFQLDQQQGNIYLRNYAREETKDEEKGAFSMGARYYIKLPPDCPVYLKTHFGLASVKNLQSKLQLNGNFTDIQLENVSGEIDVMTRFGDLTGEHLDANMTIDARRSNILLNEIKGTYDITSQYGIIKVFTDPNLIKLNIDATRSDVFLYSTQPDIFSYEIEAVHANLSTPSWMQVSQLENQPEGTKASFVPQREYFANITVKINFGELIVEKIKGGSGR